jgi:aminopeptidase Y
MVRLTHTLALSGVSSALQIPLQVPWFLEPPSHKPLSDAGVSRPATDSSKGDLPLVDSEALQASISAHNLEKRAVALYDIARLGEEDYGHPTRVIGSDGHTGTLAYIESELATLGGYYNVSTQEFPAVSGNVFESRLVIGTEVPKSASPMGLTPPTKDREPVHGDLVLVANVGCEPEDFPKEAKGNIVLVKRGKCPFGTKSELAGKAGAVAAVIYNTDPEVVHGTLGTPSPNHVATFGIGGDEGEKYAEKLKAGDMAGISVVRLRPGTQSQPNPLRTQARRITSVPAGCTMCGARSARHSLRQSAALRVSEEAGSAPRRTSRIARVSA